MMNVNRAIFIDRDGVINHDYGYVFKWSNFKFIEGSIEALKMLQSHGFLLFIVTNQSGISRGYFSESDLLALNKKICDFLSKNDIHINHIYFCPHLPEHNCICRKPSPGMLLQAEKDYHVNLQHSYMIGDKMSDVYAGMNAGVERQILIGGNNSPLLEVGSTYEIAKNLYEAAKLIVKENTS
jgi:D-glycero-D-manno-heptose 1,7-bisphosphate phosphatase